MCKHPAEMINQAVEEMDPRYKIGSEVRCRNCVCFELDVVFPNLIGICTKGILGHCPPRPDQGCIQFERKEAE